MRSGRCSGADGGTLNRAGLPCRCRCETMARVYWGSSFSFSTPAIDMGEDEKAHKISAELPGIDAKDKTSGLR